MYLKFTVVKWNVYTVGTINCVFLMAADQQVDNITA